MNDNNKKKTAISFPEGYKFVPWFGGYGPVIAPEAQKRSHCARATTAVDTFVKSKKDNTCGHDKIQYYGNPADNYTTNTGIIDCVGVADVATNRVFDGACILEEPTETEKQKQPNPSFQTRAHIRLFGEPHQIMWDPYTGKSDFHGGFDLAKTNRPFLEKAYFADTLPSEKAAAMGLDYEEVRRSYMFHTMGQTLPAPITTGHAANLVEDDLISIQNAAAHL